MLVNLDSPLDGIAGERFLSFARSLNRSCGFNDADYRRFLELEISWCRSHSLLNGSRLAYEASVRVLLDLVRLGWQVREEGYGIELFTKLAPKNGLSPTEVIEQKVRTRSLFQPIVDNELSDNSVRSFIRLMETPSAISKKRSIKHLIAEGSEIHARLAAHDIEGVKPYLQLVEGDTSDEFTGHTLREIWRYFRYSWSIPQFSTPGRQLLYLIRDGAHPNHAIMGIIGFNNCALQMGTDREYYLGWNLIAIKERFKKISIDNPENLKKEIDWMESQIALAIDDIELTGLIDRENIVNPSEEEVALLRRKAKEFDKLRDEALREFASNRAGVDIPYSPMESEDLNFSHPPVSQEVLDLDKADSNPIRLKARLHLVAKKRAAILADLLESRIILKKNANRIIKSDNIDLLFDDQEIKNAFSTVLAAVKSRVAGINMLEVSTCGAIPPYNSILGGKLASLLLFSPQIAADYRRLYSGPSIIASQIKNQPVRRTNELVYLGTTSLYSQGSSQYERVKLPAGIISEQQAELKLKKIGETAGFGTLQFTPETRDAVEKNLTSIKQFQDVNSIFGEGSSPKLRKLTAGLRVIGFPPESLMRHNCPRLIYSIPLCPQATEFLNARTCTLPDYIINPENFTGATSKIIDYWRTRWLKTRLKHEPSVAALLSAPEWMLGDRVPTEIKELKTSVLNINNKNIDSPTIWHHLASSGSKVTSDSLSISELDKLHVYQPIESFTKDCVSKGYSVFLTGNAGDGKTHLLRRLKSELTSSNCVVIEDATAVMRNHVIGPVLDKWKGAISKGVPFCIAINEYPLYLLLNEAKAHYPEIVTELEQQLSERLIYGKKEYKRPESKVILIDLSLRNPLQRLFVSSCLEKILNDPELNELAVTGSVLAYNLEKLKDIRIQDRLFSIFERLISLGIRATVRELWILLSRIVLGYRSDCTPPIGDSKAHWYSETLFQEDDRFTLFSNLSSLDPGFISHPVWDSMIEDASPELNAGWTHRKPSIGVVIRPERKDFITLKRCFFFEHVEGSRCFELERTDLGDFRKITQECLEEDTLSSRHIVQSINRAYSPTIFPGIDDSLYLWHGHRFHEQPSAGFVANRRIPTTDLALCPPRLPNSVKNAIPEYSPDHLCLVYLKDPKVRLEIDAKLFSFLSKLKNGMPRKLLPDSALFRIDQFLDKLHSSAMAERKILSVDLERRELIEIYLNSAGEKYEQIQKHG